MSRAEAGTILQLVSEARSARSTRLSRLPRRCTRRKWRVRRNNGRDRGHMLEYHRDCNVHDEGG